MKRNISHLTNQQFDVLVIGGGITGANIAWDATLRGLRVALVEKNDFGGATSSNSLKTVHGGLRYLQDANFRLVRKMIKERQAYLRIAPHLVRPLPVIMPTYKNKLMHSKLALGTAVKLNDLAGYDRNTGMDPARILPNSRIFSRSQLESRIPGLHDEAINGGVMWHDAQVVNTERFLLSFLLSAAEAGAVVANYVRVVEFLLERGRVSGVTAVDELTGQAVDIQARIVVNAAGPWVDELLQTLGTEGVTPKFRLSTAMNLVTRQILPDHALGIKSHFMHVLPDGSAEKRSRMLFIAPWRGYSIAGTIHTPYQGSANDNWVTERAIADFVEELNRAYPRAALQHEDVYHVHRGFLPMLPNDTDPATVKLVREGRIFDHYAESGLTGLLTVVGVKFTTARFLAEKTVNVIFHKLQRPSPACKTATTQLYGGQIRHYDTFVAAAMERWSVEMPPFQLHRLLTNYGSSHRYLLLYISENQAWAQPLTEDTAVTGAEVIHAVRAETARKLSDVVLRRTDMGSASKPSNECLEAAARLMALELGWDEKRVEKEVKEVETNYYLPDTHSAKH
ncbi:MAG: glycerol-3-phosphate dehydrogenase/oxidase [Anaerolineales bacterium]|nr:glycerol-3-phosphate dehydrogenase/oxidase [Anaerolineales bacterium]